MYDDITQGWVSFLARLRFAVERAPDAVRRTLVPVLRAKWCDGR